VRERDTKREGGRGRREKREGWKEGAKEGAGDRRCVIHSISYCRSQFKICVKHYSSWLVTSLALYYLWVRVYAPQHHARLKVGTVNCSGELHLGRPSVVVFLNFPLVSDTVL
jgi:hypothetical protein